MTDLQKEFEATGYTSWINADLYPDGKIYTQEYTQWLEKQVLALRQTPVSGSFYSLIDRLQKHSEWKYPERKWTNDTYYGIAFQWVGKERELEERVIKLEAEMKANKNLR